MNPETTDWILDRVAAWLAIRTHTPGPLPFVLEADPDTERVRLQTWTPIPLEHDLRQTPDAETREIARLLLAPGVPLQVADHGARSLLIGRGRIEAFWIVRRRPHISHPVVALTPNDRIALSLWLAKVQSDGAPIPLQDASAHDRLRRASLMPPMPPDLETRVRARFPHLVVVPGIRATGLACLPARGAPKILSLA